MASKTGMNTGGISTGLILRFDDLCPTVNWQVWEPLEELLIECGIKPIVSVIPDNRDKELILGEPGEDFWGRVRSWQQRGWTIGLHGYQHCYLTKHAGMYGRAARSEFAGLPYEVQEIKLRNALRIFHQHEVKPEVWVAPAHSFDANTVEILLKLGVHVINDGYALYPYVDNQGAVWIPQQVGRFRKLPVGIWTVCFHFNQWTTGDLVQFREDVKRFRHQIISVNDVLHLCKRRRSWVHAGVARMLGASLRIGRPLRESLKQRQWSMRSKGFRDSQGELG
jgi:predicted deacetylase